MKHYAKIFLTLVAFAGVPAHAIGTHWRVGPGPAFASGMEDVGTLYENNYNNSHTSTVATVDLLAPIGLSVQGTYLWSSGVRLDLGLGPFFMINSGSDHRANSVDAHLDHTEVPISATVGYTFMTNSTVSPYVRGGLVYHIVSGSYVRDSSPGFLGAVGIEFARKSFATYALEVAADRSEVEFDRYLRNPARSDTVTLNTYDVVITFLVKF